MSIFLVELQGNKWFPLNPDNPSLLIGSDDTKADLVLKDDSIAPGHANLLYKEGQWWVQDLHSEDGTYLNGKELEAGHTKAINVGDRIGLGLGEWMLTKREPLAPMDVSASQDLLETPSDLDKSKPLEPTKFFTCLE